MISQTLITTIVMIGLVFFLALYSFSTDNKLILYGMVVIPPLIFLVGRLDVLLVLSLALNVSYITLPFLPWNMSLSLVFYFLVAAAMLANRIIAKKTRPMEAQYRFALLLGAVLIITASIRGFGIKAFGGETWGGAPYIQLLIMIGFYVMARYIVLSPRQWKVALYCLCALSIVPALGQALYAFSGGRIYHQFLFIWTDYSTLSYARDLMRGQAMSRFQLANISSLYLFMLACLLLHDFKKNRYLVIPLFALSLFLSGISGHRIVVIYMFVFSMAYLWADPRRKLAQCLLNRYTMVLFVIWIVLMVVARQLPLAYQRALSWIPLVHVLPEAQASAGGTSGWRLEMWKLALHEIPKYLLVGKGFAFSSSDIATIYYRTLLDELTLTLATRNYHNAVLATIMDLGLPGLFTAFAFIGAVLVRETRQMKIAWRNPTLQHYHHVFYAGFIAQVVVYFFMAGGINTYHVFLVWSTILTGLVQTDQAEVAEPVTEAVPESTAWGFSPET